MRTDSKLDLKANDFSFLYGGERPLEKGFSWSGNERNHLFLNAGGKKFYDIGGISGLDHPGDSRSFAIIDYDRDGWPDIAMVNNNTPLVQLFRNRIGDQSDAKVDGQILALRFVGGNKAAQSSKSWSNRDGIGALVTVTLDSLTIKREYRAGEGLAAQNSPTMLIGLGKATQIESLRVRWPSGKSQEIQNIPAGTLLTVYENPADSPNEEAFRLEPYVVLSLRQQHNRSTATDTSGKRLQLSHLNETMSRPKLRLYTTMATWCAACKSDLPQLQNLNALFDKEVLALYGVPVDEKESRAKLNAFIDKYRPAYELLTDLNATEVNSIQAWIKESLKQEGIPATIVTDSEGYVLLTTWRVPSVSDIRKILAKTND